MEISEISHSIQDNPCSERSVCRRRVWCHTHTLSLFLDFLLPFQPVSFPSSVSPPIPLMVKGCTEQKRSLQAHRLVFSSTSCYLFYGCGVIKEIDSLSCWHDSAFQNLQLTILRTYFDCWGKWSLTVSAQSSSAQADILVTISTELKEHLKLQ